MVLPPVLLLLMLLLLTDRFQLTMSSEEDFRGHRLLRVIPVDRTQVEILQKLHYHPPDNLHHLDVWTEPSEPGDDVYIRVQPHQLTDLEQFLFSQKIPFQIVVDNLQHVLDDHALKNLETRLDKEISIYDSYLTYDEALVWLRKEAELCGERCSLFSIGRSFEGRNLTVLKVSSDDRSSSDPKKAVWIDGAIHAREWISPATALYIIDRLVSDYDFDEETRYLVNKYDWYILPFVNPDGYEYSHVKNRLWRKTRSRLTSSASYSCTSGAPTVSSVSSPFTSGSSNSCVGVDANRNFGFHWRSVGFGIDPCSDLFPGPGPFSEPETKALAEFILSKNGSWEVFLTLHSYGQLWMAPFGYTTQKPYNYNSIMTAASAAKRAIKNVYGTEYKIGSAYDILYQSSGTSRDWAAGSAGIPFVYTVELRDRGEHGFLLPPDQILPTGIETWEGVKAALKNIDQQEQQQQQQEQLLLQRQQ